MRGRRLLLWLAAPAAAFAQAPAEPQRIEIRGNEQSDTEQRRRDPIGRQIYGREELDRHGDTNVGDVLKRLPGITLQGGAPRLRGLGAGFTLVLVNGERPPPGFSLENLSPGEVERIEVIKGPSAEHGAQAVAGTINIILRAATRSRQRELNLRLASSGHRTVPSGNAHWSQSEGAFGWALPLAAWQWSGGNRSISLRTLPDANGAPQTIAAEGTNRWWGGGVSFGPRLTWRPAGATSIEFSSYAQRNEFRSAGSTRHESIAGAPPPNLQEGYRNRGHWQMWRAGAQLTQRLAGGARFEGRLGQQDSDSVYRTPADIVPSAAPAFIRLTTGASRERSQTTAGKLTWPVGETHTLAAGWDLEDKRRREVRSVLENGVEQLLDFEGEPFVVRVERQALWLQDEWAISEQWSSVIGLRGERIQTSGDAGQGGLRQSTSGVATPLLHLTWKPDPKRRDLVRFGLNRSYRAPETQALMARPSISASYPASGPNVAIAPDRVGNPALKPELSAGLDIAFERYLDGGAVASLGLFHRRIEGLIRPVLRLQSVSWSPLPRWVSQPDNLDRARSTGIEAEIKGKLNQWWPGSGAPDGITVRASLGWYRSTVDALPGPDNRLEGQQPWSLSLGFDQVIANPGWAWGASVQATPAYVVQQTAENRLWNGDVRKLDLYLLWRPDRQRTLRLGVNDLEQRPQLRETLTQVSGAPVQTFDSRTSTRRQAIVAFSWKFD